MSGTEEDVVNANDADYEDEAEDLSSDDMGAGLHGETIEEIMRIQEGAGTAEGPGEIATQEETGRDVQNSEAWEIFTKGKKNSDGSYAATCKYCSKSYLQGNSRSTGSILHHYRRGCKKMPRKRQKIDAMQKMLVRGKSSTGSSVLNWVFDQLRSRKNLAKMVIAHDYPFNIVKHHFLKVFLKDLQPKFSLPSRNTLKHDCLNVYEDGRDELYRFLGKLDCKLSFTSDLWSSKGNDRGFMSLTCHYIDDNWVLKKRILNFTPLPTPHTGVHISKVIYEKLVLWNLDKKVFCLVLDNAASNDAAVRDLLSNRQFKKHLPVDGNVFHQRCGCHILNLIVQDGLGQVKNEIETIRATMKYIRFNQSRMEKFKLAASQAECTERKPAWDVSTRWNSTYLMLELALKLQGAITRYAAIDTSYTLCPSEQDWIHVKVLLDHLRVFYNATLKLGGTKYPTLNLYFTEFCDVYLTIKKMESSSYEFVARMGREMFVKWDKYWKLGSALLAMACVFDPRCKLQVVQYYYNMMLPDECEAFMTNLMACLNTLFKEYQKASATQAEVGSSAGNRRVGSSSNDVVTDVRAGLNAYLSGMRTTEPTKTELEQYLAEPLDENSLDRPFDILSWWKLSCPKYPLVAKMARDILAVPNSTVASESCFSVAGRTLSPVRSSLSDESLEALICAQDWLHASVDELGDQFGDFVWSTEEEAKEDTICGN